MALVKYLTNEEERRTCIITLEDIAEEEKRGQD
jgi:hypothetical protein